MPIRRYAAADVAVALTAVVVAVSAAGTPARAHEVVLHVGRTAGGQLRVDADLHHAITLPPSIFAGIPGHAAGEPAFHSVGVDDAANDLLRLAPAASVHFAVTSADPGIGVYTPSGMLALNSPVLLGQGEFDYHPVWHIPAGQPGTTYNITVKVQDTTGTYTDSAPLTIPFVVPEPQAVTLLALTSLALHRRRRRAPAH